MKIRIFSIAILLAFGVSHAATMDHATTVDRAAARDLGRPASADGLSIRSDDDPASDRKPEIVEPAAGEPIDLKTSGPIEAHGTEEVLDQKRGDGIERPTVMPVLNGSVAAAAPQDSRRPEEIPGADRTESGGSEMFDGSSNTHKVVLIPGDGIGPEVTQAAREVIAAAGVKIDWEVRDAGRRTLASEGTSLPDATVEAVRRVGVALKGPMDSHDGHRPNVDLRQKLGTYVNYRPVRIIPGTKPLFKDINLIIIRENSEGLYAGIEREVEPGVIESVKRTTRAGSERIARYAFETARKLGRRKVTVVHKANILPLGDGLFRDVAFEVAKSYPEIAVDEVHVDWMFAQMVKAPSFFDVLLTSNEVGDFVSDLANELAGSFTSGSGANLADDVAVFEAVHGSAPPIAGKGIANPTGVIQSAILMLRHLGESIAADRIEAALFRTLADPATRTGDLGGRATTRQFTDAIIGHLRNPQAS